MSVLPPSIQRVLAVQHGMVSAAQLSVGGFSRRRLRWMLDSGEWQRTHSGIYFAGRQELPWMARVWTAALIYGDESLIGSTSAARLHGITRDDPAVVTVFVPNGRTHVARPGIEAIRSRTFRQSQFVAGVRCTTVPETIVDCAGVLTSHALEALIGRAFQQRRCGANALAKAIRGRRTVCQRALLDAAASAASLGAHSALEMLYLRDVERAHGIPAAERQVRIGECQEWVDLFYALQRVVIELDGRAFHRDAAFRDRERDNRNAVIGVLTLRFGWADVAGDPCGVARRVATALGFDALRRCPRCPTGS